MNLIRALRIPDQPHLAAVGAGGKTSLLFQLGHELLLDKMRGKKTVFLTTTTHLAKWQVASADHHVMIDIANPLPDWGGQMPAGLIVITGAEEADQRLAHLDDGSLIQVKALAETHGIPVLIEADGARLHSLKAPGMHEPVIPAWVNQVVVVAGLSTIGNPLSEESVHRAERFAHLTGLKMGDVITPDAILRELACVDGGLKHIPDKASRAVLLTQANTPELQAQANSIAESLLSSYERVVISQSLPGQVDGQRLVQLDIRAVHEPIAGIVLAAGGSARLGQPKQLLEWDGKPFVRRVAETALQSGLWPVIVVVGAFMQDVCAALKDLPVQLVSNTHWEDGQASSVQCGIQALPEKTGGVVFLLSDQPQTSLRLLRALIERHQQTLAPIVAPLIDGQRGNPVLFDQDTFPSFAGLHHDQGGRKLFAQFQVEWVEWHDPAGLMDVDTWDDYLRLIAVCHSEKYE